MRRKGKSRSDELYLKNLGHRIHALIQKKGYVSPYDFWVEQFDDLFSRTSLHYILIGKADPKITTLKAIAECLEISLSQLLDFEEKSSTQRDSDEI